MTSLLISVDEAEETLERRLHEGVKLFRREVVEPRQMRRFYAETVNWQTLNYTFLRSAYRGKTEAVRYREQTMQMQPRHSSLDRNVAEVKDSLLTQMHHLKELSRSLRPEIVPSAQVTTFSGMVI